MGSQWRRASFFFCWKNSPHFQETLGFCLFVFVDLCVHVLGRSFLSTSSWVTPSQNSKPSEEKNPPPLIFSLPGNLATLNFCLNLYKRVSGTRFGFCAVIPLLVLSLTHKLTPSSCNSNAVKINFCHPKLFCTQKTDVVLQDSSGMYVIMYPFMNQFLLVWGFFCLEPLCVYHTHFIMRFCLRIWWRTVRKM